MLSLNSISLGISTSLKYLVPLASKSVFISGKSSNLPFFSAHSYQFLIVVEPLSISSATSPIVTYEYPLCSLIFIHPPKCYLIILYYNILKESNLREQDMLFRLTTYPPSHLCQTSQESHLHLLQELPTFRLSHK